MPKRSYPPPGPPAAREGRGPRKGPRGGRRPPGGGPRGGLSRPRRGGGGGPPAGPAGGGPGTDDERRPAGLVARADAAARCRRGSIRGRGRGRASAGRRRSARRRRGTGARPWRRAGRGRRGAARDLARDLREVHEDARAGGALDAQVVAVEVVVALQRLDEQVVDGEPDRAAPVRVAAEEAGRRLARRRSRRGTPGCRVGTCKGCSRGTRESERMP